MTRRFCMRCGAQLDDGVAFCTKCGTPIGSTGAQGIPAAPYAAPNIAPQQKVGKPRKGIIIGIILAVIAVIAIVAAIILFVLPNTNTTTGASGSMPAQSAAVSQPSSSSSTSSSATGATPPAFSSIEVSSQLPGDNDTADYGAVNLTDGNPETAWNEGADGDGAGEWVRLSASTPQHVTSISIMGGFPKLYKDGSDIYPKNNRPKDITISYNGGSETFTMTDTRGEFQTFTLAHPVDTTQLTITIDSVYKGTKFDECCIAEIAVQ